MEKYSNHNIYLIKSKIIKIFGNYDQCGERRNPYSDNCNNENGQHELVMYRLPSLDLKSMT
jgi:hypothetical protein